MSKKIFLSITGVCVLTYISVLLLFILFLNNHFDEEQYKQLDIEMHLLATAVETDGTDYLESLGECESRITWIAGNGTVLYDTDVDMKEMENHLEREEVQKALESGRGVSKRYSNTLESKELYSAMLLKDGSILRVSVALSSEMKVIKDHYLQFIGLAVILFAIALYFAIFLSKRIVKPINSIDLNRPLDCVGKEGFEEIEPLLRRMALQQEEIRCNEEELQKTSQIRQEFTANVSHELKTPLHVISGYAEIIESGLVEEKDIKPFASKIRTESQRMSQLVEDIISLTKLDSGEYQQEMTWVDLLRITENAVDSLRPEADEKGIEIVVEGSRAEMYGIAKVLYSIVYNLCDNAIKYQPHGGHIYVRIEKNENETILSVKDEGIGIPKEYQSRIFERFFRVDKSRSKEVGGTGLGLSIVKHGAMNHHASIEVQSEEGKGSLFCVKFSAN